MSELIVEVKAVVGLFQIEPKLIVTGIPDGLTDEVVVKLRKRVNDQREEER